MKFGTRVRLVLYGTCTVIIVCPAEPTVNKLRPNMASVS